MYNTILLCVYIRLFLFSIKIEISSQLTFTDTIIIQGMYNLNFQKQLATKKYTLTTWRTLYHKMSAATNSTWLIEHHSSSRVLLYIFFQQTLFITIQHSSLLEARCLCWLLWLPFTCVGCYRFRRQTRLCSLCQCSC